MKKLLALGLLWGPCALAQTLTISKVELAGEKVVVYYSLQDSNPNNEYQLKLYSSRDNYISPLARVTGDVGDEVKSGNEKKMEWKIMDEFGPYKGRIALEIRGKVFTPFVKFKNLDVSKGYKRGKAIDLGWKVGATNPISIELMKGSQRVVGESNLANSGTHTVYIPSSAKPGKDYRLKVTDSRTSDVIYTDVFAVKPKVPFLLKVLPVALIGVGVAALAGGGSKKDNGTTTSQQIADPAFPN